MRLFLFAFAALWGSLSVLARAADVVTIAVVPPTPVTVWTPIIVAGIPVLIMLVKRYIPPAWYDHVKPIFLLVAPLLGMLGDWLSTWATGQAANPAAGVAMGIAAVFVREGIDQVRRSPLTPDSWTPPTPATKAGADVPALPTVK